MKLVHFDEVNIVFAKNQPQYLPAPAYKFFIGDGEVVMCWKMNFWEKIKCLFTGKIWVSLVMFGHPLTPSKLSVNKKDVLDVVAICDNDLHVHEVYPWKPLRESL